MADGVCSESDRKHFVAALINENVLSAGEKLEKCVNLALKKRVQSVTGESERGECVKTRVNREQQNMTASSPQQQQQQQSNKMTDAKLSKNKSVSKLTGASQGATGLQGGAGVPATNAGAAVVGAATAAVVAAAASGGGGGGVPNTGAGKSNNAGRDAAVAVQLENIGPPKVKSIALKTAASAGVASVPKSLQKKDLKGAAKVDMAATSSVSEPGQQQKKHHQQQQDTDDNPSAKKKRCSDRYDSSESSDSGVATLSCTDSSTASSDASDPGSPYSPASLGEDANQLSTKANMPPQILSITQQNHRVHHSHQSHHQTTTTSHQTTHHHKQPQKQQQTTTTVQHQWPWNVSSNNNTISNHNNSSSNYNNNIIVNASNKSNHGNSVNSALSGNNQTNAKNKRISSANPSDINGTAKKVRTSASTVDRMQSPTGPTATVSKRLKAQQEESTTQKKITGYFKSQKPLKASTKSELSTLVNRTATTDAQSNVACTATGALDKYFNIAGTKTATSNVPIDTKDEEGQNNQRKPVAIKKDFIDLPPLTQTMPPSLKKLERKSAKIAQVAPISRKTTVGQQLKSPKKPIAIAPRTADVNQLQSQKPPQTNAFQIDQTKISQPTVLLTAIRIPPQANTQPQQQGSVPQPSTTKAPPLTPTKMGSMLQIPVVSNLVQIPNLLATTNGANLVMNNGQLARVGNGGQYFLNGTVLKLQQISNGHSANGNNTNGVLTVDSSTLQGNILVKQSPAISQSMPIVASSAQTKSTALTIQQPMVSQSSMNGSACHPAFLTATGQRVPTQSVLMATSSGWYVLNQSTADSISNNIPHQATLTTAMVCKSTRTSVTSLTNAISPPVPPLVTLGSKLDTSFTSGPKVLSPSIPASVPTIVELKDASRHSVEPDKPLTVECPPLDVPAEINGCTPSLALKNKLESPKVVPVLRKSLSPPTIVTTVTADELGDERGEATVPTSTPKCAISPILSQPKTIRFPVPSGCEAGYRFGPKGTKRPDGVCYWDKCNAKYDTNSKLLDHLQTQHVNTQTGPFSCLWFGCKVRGRESCSRRWLERHVLSHGGTKPFKCIVDGCGLRLGSQLALQKHVNGHFNATESKDNQSKRTSDPPVPKQLRKNGKKLRYRRQPFSARMFDFFDTGIMEGLQHRLMVTGSLASGEKGSITFQGQTIARRKTLSGITELYVKWSPSEILPDEWVPESKHALTKSVTIQSMQYQERLALQKYLQATSLKSDISIKTVSKSQQFPSAVRTLSSLIGDDSSDGVDYMAVAPVCGRKQQRKPPKRNQIQPS